jgi:hypothetical protein
MRGPSWSRMVLFGGAGLVLGGIATALQAETSGTLRTTFAVVAVVAGGVGASLLASGLAARLVTRQVFGLDAAEAIEALRGTSDLSRSNQELRLTLALDGDDILVQAEHLFDVLGAGRWRRRAQFGIYTDIARWGLGGGFRSVHGPDGDLTGHELDPYLHEVGGKPRFERVYSFRPGVPERFVVDTYGKFRKSDRLFWTVEHISSDFHVRVDNCVPVPGTIGLKVNHHREAQITENVRRRRAEGRDIMEFDFLGAILPFQGFELQWKFE